MNYNTPPLIVAILLSYHPFYAYEPDVFKLKVLTQ